VLVTKDSVQGKSKLRGGSRQFFGCKRYFARFSSNLPENRLCDELSQIFCSCLCMIFISAVLP